MPDRARWVPVPDLYFSRLVTEAADAATIKVALHVFWRIARRAGGDPPALRSADLESDPALLRSLAAGRGATEPAESIKAALGWLVENGWLIEGYGGDAEPHRWVWLNVPEGRRHHERWSSGRVELPESPVLEGHPPAERGDVVAMYEENFGSITPMLAEELIEAEAAYPESWIEDAMRLALASNVRRWSYVRAILERWSREGRGDEADRRGVGEGRERDTEGPFRDYVRH